MAKSVFYSLFLLLCFLLPSDFSPIKAVPQSQRAAGVFLLTDGGTYTFNFTAARAACLSLNISMATSAHMERALQQGLETCKYGWIEEQIAVIPRLRSNANCGKGKTGVVMWTAKPDKEFGAFCFNSSDVEEPSTAAPQSSTSSTTLTTSTSTTPPITTTTTTTSTKPPPSTQRPTTTESPKQTPSPSVLLDIMTLFTTVSSSTSSSCSPTTHHPHFITSKSTISTHVSTSVHESELTQSVSSLKHSLGPVPTAIIILSIILLLLTAAGVTLYYKHNSAICWSPGHRRMKEFMETEMWRHTDSEMDLHSQHGEEEDEDESDRKYSSDITLCVNPNVRTDSSEQLFDN